MIYTILLKNMTFDDWIYIINNSNSQLKIKIYNDILISKHLHIKIYNKFTNYVISQITFPFTEEQYTNHVIITITTQKHIQDLLEYFIYITRFYVKTSIKIVRILIQNSKEF